MKIDIRKKIRSVAGENIVMMPSAGTTDMTQVVALNDSALELYNILKEREFTLDDVVRALLDTYEVDEATARADAEKWVAQMRKQRLIID